jgi:hypothetical protein
MGSNPILAAIYQRNYRAASAASLVRGRRLLPNFYHLGAASPLAPDDPVEMGGGSALILLKRVNIDA